MRREDLSGGTRAGSRFDAGRGIEGNGRGPLPSARRPRAERGRGRSLSRRGRRSTFEFRSGGYSRSPGQAGGFCLPVGEKIGNGVAGSASRRGGLRQTSRGGHDSLEGG